MAYSTVDYINDLAAHLDIDEYSDPTDTEVETMIADIDAQMDGRFKAVGVSVPVTDSTLLKIVKTISAHGTLAMIYRSTDVESEMAATFQSLFESAMKNIERRPAILSTGTTESAAPTGSSRNGDAPFERGETQW